MIYYITNAIIRIQSCPPVGHGFHFIQHLFSAYPLLGAYLFTTYTYKHICLLTTRVYSIAPSKCPFPYQHPFLLEWFCCHRSQVSERKHCNCEGRVTFLTSAVSGVEKGPFLQDVNCTWVYPEVQNSKKSKATVDWENFTVKIILQLRPTAKI